MPSALAAAVIVGLAAAAGPDESPIPSLLVDLDSRDYATRESAERTLRGFGADVVPYAESFAPRTAEGLLRLQRLAADARAAWFLRLSEQARGGATDVLDRLPAGETVSPQVGRDGRAWLAAMLSDRLSRLPSASGDPNDLFRSLWVKIPNRDISDPLPQTTAALFYGTRAGVDLTLSDAYKVRSWLHRSDIRNAFANDVSGPVLRRLASDFLSALPSEGRAYLLEDAAGLKLRGLAPVAYEVLAGAYTAEQKATALRILAAERSEEHLGAVLPLVSSRETVARPKNRLRGAPVSLGDVALVTAILTTGQDPREYGYRDVRMTSDGGFLPKSASPASWGGTGRAERQFETWAKTNLAEEQPAPRAAVFGQRL